MATVHHRRRQSKWSMCSYISISRAVCIDILRIKSGKFLKSRHITWPFPFSLLLSLLCTFTNSYGPSLTSFGSCSISSVFKSHWFFPHTSRPIFELFHSCWCISSFWFLVIAALCCLCLVVSLHLFLNCSGSVAGMELNGWPLGNNGCNVLRTCKSTAFGHSSWSVTA